MPKWMISASEMPSEQEVRERQAWVATVYPEAVIEEIAKAARFTTTKDKSDMQEFLVKAGYWYLERKDDRESGASFATDKKQLETIASLADKLDNALTNLSDVSSQSLWHPFQQVMTGPPTGQTYVTDYGLTIIERPLSDGRIAIDHLRPDQIGEAIYVIRCLAEQAAAGLPSQKGGQPQIGTRQSWILSAQHFWRGHSPIAFHPKSVAHDFCYKAFKRLDPNVAERQIDSAMRAANKRFPDPKNRRTDVGQEP